MLKQRTININRSHEKDRADGWVTVAAFGAQKRVKAGKSVSETLAELGWAPEPYQSVRVGGREVKHPGQKRTKGGEVLTVTNRVVGGWA